MTERLADAKFKRIKEYYSAMGGLDPDIQEDMRWLINRVEELEKELTHQAEHFDICYYVIEKEKKVVEEQNKRYKQALENITISPIPLEIDDAVNIALQALEGEK